MVPLALATLCALVCAFGGGHVSPDEFLEDWGVISPEEAADRAAQEAMDNLRILAEKMNHGKQDIG